MERDAGSIVISREKAVIPLMQTVFLSKDVMGVRSIDAVRARAFLESTVRHVDSIWLNGYYEISLEYYGLEGKKLYKHTIELPLKVELPKWWQDASKENIDLSIIEPTIEVLSPYVLEFNGKILAESKTKNVMDVAKKCKHGNQKEAAPAVSELAKTGLAQQTKTNRELSQKFPLPEVSELKLERKNEVYLETPRGLLREREDFLEERFFEGFEQRQSNGVIAPVNQEEELDTQDYTVVDGNASRLSPEQPAPVAVNAELDSQTYAVISEPETQLEAKEVMANTDIDTTDYSKAIQEAEPVMNSKVEREYLRQQFDEDRFDEGKLNETLYDEGEFAGTDLDPGVSAESLEDRYIVPSMVQNVMKKYDAEPNFGDGTESAVETVSQPQEDITVMADLKEKAKASIAQKIAEAASVPVHNPSERVDMEALQAKTLAKIKAEQQDKGLAVLVKINEKPLEEPKMEVVSESDNVLNAIEVTATEAEKEVPVLKSAEAATETAKEEYQSSIIDENPAVDEVMAEDSSQQVEAAPVSKEQLAEEVEHEPAMEEIVEEDILPVMVEPTVKEAAVSQEDVVEVTATDGTEEENEILETMGDVLKDAAAEDVTTVTADMATEEAEEMVEAMVEAEGIEAAEAQEAMAEESVAVTAPEEEAVSTVLRAKILMERECPIPTLRSSGSGYKLKFYMVQNGEDLVSIALKHNISPEMLRAANPVMEESVRTGMVLSIPCQQ